MDNNNDRSNIALNTNINNISNNLGASVNSINISKNSQLWLITILLRLNKINKNWLQSTFINIINKYIYLYIYHQYYL